MSQDHPESQTESVDLTHLDAEFDSAEIKDTDFEPIPDGKYQVGIERAEIVNAKTTGNPMLKWTLRILSHPFKDRLLWKNSVLISGLMEYVKRDLQTCGLQLTKISELGNHLNELLDVRLEIVKKTKNGSENIFINKRLSGAENSYEEAAKEAMTPF